MEKNKAENKIEAIVQAIVEKNLSTLKNKLCPNEPLKPSTFKWWLIVFQGLGVAAFNAALMPLSVAKVAALDGLSANLFKDLSTNQKVLFILMCTVMFLSFMFMIFGTANGSKQFLTGKLSADNLSTYANARILNRMLYPMNLLIYLKMSAYRHCICLPQ